MNKQNRIFSVSCVLILLCALTFTGCEQLGDSSNGTPIIEGSSMIQIERVDFNGDNATVIYEDGYTIELPNLCDSPLKYLQEPQRLAGSNADSKEEDKEEANEETKQESEQASTEHSTDDGLETDSSAMSEENTATWEDAPSTETTDSSPHVSIIPVSPENALWGVRVMGTASGPKISFSISGIAGDLSIDSSISIGSMPSLDSSTTASLLNVLVINGKLYEDYASHLAEYFEKNLKEATILENGKNFLVTVILEKGFYHLSALEKVTVPASITHIRASAFEGCKSLKEIRFLGTMEQWNAIEKDTNWDLETGAYTVYCTDGTITP